MLERAQAVLEERTGLAFDAAARMRLAAGLDAAAAGGRPARELVRALESGDAQAERELIEAVTLQETSFFRDPAVFDALAAEVLPQLPDPVTVWSAGCARGQEAYSLAMLLHEQGRREFRVLATDLSPDSVARTRAGIYSARELRGLDAARIERHLRPLGDGTYVVDPALRACLDVRVHNLARDPVPEPAAACRLVLCRYVLIYVQRPVIDVTLRRLHGALPPEALVVVGAAESLWHLTDRFALEPLGTGFGYRRVAAGGASPAPGGRGAARRPGPETARPRSAVRAGGAGRVRPGSPAAGVPAAAAPAGSPTPTELLTAGERAHDAGEFAAAAAIFRQAAYLAPGNPLAHLRLGLALEAGADPGAPRAFRAALRALDAADPQAVERELRGHHVGDLARLIADRLGAG